MDLIKEPHKKKTKSQINQIFVDFIMNSIAKLIKISNHTLFNERIE